MGMGDRFIMVKFQFYFRVKLENEKVDGIFNKFLVFMIQLVMVIILFFLIYLYLRIEFLIFGYGLEYRGIQVLCKGLNRQ